MLGLASEKAVYELKVAVHNLEARLAQLETDWKAQVAALENAADLYNRAAARAERSKPRGGGDQVGAGVGSIDELRRRRGGV